MNLLKRLGIALTLVGMTAMILLPVAPAQAGATAEEASKAKEDDGIVAGPFKPAQPQLLNRVSAFGQFAAQGSGLPTFREVPLPDVPQGSGWTWTYHRSRWNGGTLEDKVSYGGWCGWLEACGCDFISYPKCPAEYCDQ